MQLEHAAPSYNWLEAMTFCNEDSQKLFQLSIAELILSAFCFFLFISPSLVPFFFFFCGRLHLLDDGARSSHKFLGPNSLRKTRWLLSQPMNPHLGYIVAKYPRPRHNTQHNPKGKNADHSAVSWVLIFLWTSCPLTLTSS